MEYNCEAFAGIKVGGTPTSSAPSEDWLKKVWYKKLTNIILFSIIPYCFHDFCHLWGHATVREGTTGEKELSTRALGNTAV